MTNAPSTKNHTGRRASRKPQKRSKDRRLVLLDQQPLRRKAATECSRAMARLEKAKVEWRRYQQDDQAAFSRWTTSTFGAILSRVREIEEAVRVKESLVQEVEMEILFGDTRSARAAYTKVQSRRDNPQPEADPHSAPPPRHEGEAFEDDPFGEIPEFEQEMLFDDYLRAVMGMDPERMSERKYEKMFADFKANFLGEERPEVPSAPPSPHAEQSRLKELYRLLVRRLHPDIKADKDAAVSAIWHEVQQAYSDGNIERLEMLLAMTDLQANATGEHTSLSQMRSVLTELRRAFNTLQRSLRAAKNDPAWNFCSLTDRSAVEKRVRGELESRLQLQENLLRDLDALIARWSAPTKGRKKPARTKQPEFFF